MSQRGIDRLGIFLVSLPMLIWCIAILYLCRVNGFILDRWLLKAPGIYFSYGVLAFLPPAAIIMGWRTCSARPVWGRVMMALGFLMSVAFVPVIGIPLVQQLLDEKTPKNPGSPRPLLPMAGLPVFPGAEGFGTHTPAGRGGKLLAVTSLADSGPGTLRSALETPGARIIVFRRGGTIELKGELYVNHPFVTVAGQTAPGDGICLKNHSLVITTHDVLIQHVRVRPGNQGDTDADDNDAIKIFGQRGDFVGAKNVVLDHVSASWSEDEVISTWFGPREITICWSIISEALNRSRHRKKTHSAGLLIGDSTDHVSVHHNLLAHNSFRNPLIIGGGTHDIVNNVIYNWGDLPAEVVDTDSNSFLNFVANHFINGPSSVLPDDAVIINGNEGVPQIFVEGNRSARRPSDAHNQWSVVTQNWSGMSALPIHRAAQRFAAPTVTSWDVKQATRRVLKEAGATLPRRDPVDQRVVSDVINGSGHVIDSPNQVGGYPQLAAGTPPVDTDQDGIPDTWEQDHGLNPHDPADGNRSPEANGYTNIELYLHSLLSAGNPDQASPNSAL